MTRNANTIFPKTAWWSRALRLALSGVALSVALTGMRSSPKGIVSTFLPGLVSESDVIVLGIVVDERKTESTVEVLEVWLGDVDAGMRVRVRTAGFENHDMPSASLGELALFCLVAEGGDPAVYGIAHFGRGRLPILALDSAACVAYADIIMPKPMWKMKVPTPSARLWRNAALLTELRNQICAPVPTGK